MTDNTTYLTERIARLSAERDELRLRDVLAVDQMADLIAEREQLREMLTEALEILGPCDTDNPHVALWCINHQEKSCPVPALRARVAALEQPARSHGVPAKDYGPEVHDAPGWPER